MCRRRDLPEENAIKNSPWKTAPEGGGEYGVTNKMMMQEAEKLLEKSSKSKAYMVETILGSRINDGLDTVKRRRKKWET